MRGMLRLRLLALLAAIAVLAAHAGARLALATPAIAAERASPRDLLKAARSWGYQLQNVEAAKLQRTTFDVLVVDAGSGDGAWGLSRPDVERLKTKPDGTRRLLVAYMNIGEAEDYRYYWKPSWKKRPPPWMGSQNCRWKGDHRVRHWSPAWQAILFGTPDTYLGRLIGAGYDGVYLDRVDIYYHWRASRWQAGAEMVDLVVALSRWAKARKPGFLVIPQNGEELVSDPRYLAAIDGLGKEDMLFGDRGNEIANAPERVARAERNMAPLLAAGLPVLAVEYARRPDTTAAAAAGLARLGFTAYFGPRSLAYIGREGPPHPEDGDTESAVTSTDDGVCE